jgi:hypothetical protein
MSRPLDLVHCFDSTVQIQFYICSISSRTIWPMACVFVVDKCKLWLWNHLWSDLNIINRITAIGKFNSYFWTLSTGKYLIKPRIQWRPLHAYRDLFNFYFNIKVCSYSYSIFYDLKMNDYRWADQSNIRLEI